MALRHKNFKMMEWLKDKGCLCNENTFSFTAHHENLEGMMWLKRNDCPWDEKTFAVAAREGNIEQIEWLRVNGCPMANQIRTKKCLEDETIVRWFNTNGYRIIIDFGFARII